MIISFMSLNEIYEPLIRAEAYLVLTEKLQKDFHNQMRKNDSNYFSDFFTNIAFKVIQEKNPHNELVNVFQDVSAVNGPTQIFIWMV